MARPGSLSSLRPGQGAQGGEAGPAYQGEDGLGGGRSSGVIG